MISIIMAYFNRKQQLIRTLDSIYRSQYKDFEIIIVDDASDKEHQLNDLQDQYKFNLIKISPEDKKHKESGIPFNTGFNYIKGDMVLIQNPECLHHSDILLYIYNELCNNKYISFACYALSPDQTMNYKPDISINYRPGDYGIYADYQSRREGWFNHRIFRPTGYHFAAAITAKNLSELHGFDERFAETIAGGDIDFVSRIRRKGLNIIVTDENNLVLHQFHEPTELSFEHTSNAQLRSYSDVILRQSIKDNLIVPKNNKVYKGHL